MRSIRLRVLNAIPMWLALILFSISLAGVGMAAPSERKKAEDEKAQTIVHMLDYIGVDYPQTVQNGQIINPEEYAEQREFATQVITLLSELPPAPEQALLVQQARELLTRVEDRSSGDQIATLTDQLHIGVIQAWTLQVAPRQPPDLTRAGALFAQQCAACHGAQGLGDGPLAKAMEPAPRNFHDDARMRQRSLYGLYNTISLGVQGTPMRAFRELSESDRWTLAFFVAGLRTAPEAVAKGEALWQQGEGISAFSSLRAFVTTAPVQQGPVGSSGDDIRAYLTQQPQALQVTAHAPLAYSRKKIEDAALAYANGNRDEARRLAIAAYLEGFELIESALSRVDASLRTETEREMMGLRTAIVQGLPPDAISAHTTTITKLLDRADTLLSSGSLSPNTTFVSSLLILLREGLESILILSAIIAFAIKTGRRDALPYIHLGLIGAAGFGAITWGIARYALSISGANREMTEGITALLAAAMLLYVGWWLHSRSNAQAWNRYVREQLSTALAKPTLWAMAGISFLVVYRELFEMILFYETLWSQAGVDGHNAVLGGIAAAAFLLLLVGSMILRYSVRLPIGPFFAVASILLAVMAVIFVGNGIAALQAADVLEVTKVHFVSLPTLGIYPTMQSLVPQFLILVLIAGGIWSNRTKAE